MADFSQEHGSEPAISRRQRQSIELSLGLIDLERALINEFEKIGLVPETGLAPSLIEEACLRKVQASLDQVAVACLDVTSALCALIAPAAGADWSDDLQIKLGKIAKLHRSDGAHHRAEVVEVAAERLRMVADVMRDIDERVALSRNTVSRGIQ